MNSEKNDRRYWLDTLVKLAAPVLEHAANRSLKAVMPVEAGDPVERAKYSHLEALGRLLAGIAPWLERRAEDPEEERLRLKFAAWAVEAIDSATDETSPDYMNFTEGHQPIVDTAFLAHAILRAPGALWHPLDKRVRNNVAAALRSTRDRKPPLSNWLLFSAMIETALRFMGSDWDPMRVDFALKQHEQWYKGDGAYGDGPDFHWDYYNSFVIQPMLVDILDSLEDLDDGWKEQHPHVLRRATRYSAVLERMIAPDGSFPVLGRSIAYRCGAFQMLAQSALQHRLPDRLPAGQARSALTAVIRRCMDPVGTFDENGWLRIGLSGSQPELGERYISTGSLYLCAVVLLPLGLSESDPFWSDDPLDWTSRQVWGGAGGSPDQAIYG
ncbi:DUF2264 domain-containing protein [Cohnella lupini]|uniref:DUF2264 domain-containing protein n=1 Tax=Cohnella lupini TaxID=1294267 RepID=A0A3D9INE5_9BACL|nr:DUF2264 domain-containing protein [Cohnella lupini]RED63241.1 hypothetical protein DFP95_104235 [Cohnella lupini]